MLDRNSGLIRNLRQLTTDMAHDLRTPIAHLRQGLGRALALAPEDGRLRLEIEGAVEQSDAALSLFPSLLRIAEIESGLLKRYFRPIDLSAAVRSIGESYALAAEDSGRVVAVGARWLVTPGIKFDIRIGNVFDEIYAVSSYAGNGTQQILGAPRSATASLSLAF